MFQHRHQLLLAEALQEWWRWLNAFCLQGFAELQLFELGKALDAVLFTQFLERGHGLLFETAWSKQGFRIALARQSRSRLCADPTAALKLLFRRVRLLPMSLNLSMKIEKRLCNSTACA